MRRLPVRLRNRCVNGPLQQQPGPHQHADGRKRHQHQPPADPEDDAEKQQHERHVPQRHQRRGGEEFPHRFKVAHAVGQRPRALRPRRPAHRQKLPEDARPHRHVEAPPRRIHQIPAHQAHPRIRQHNDDNPDQQRHQARQGVVGDHPVIDRHGEQRDGNRRQIDEQPRQDRVAIKRPVGEQRPAKPLMRPLKVQKLTALVKVIGRREAEHRRRRINRVIRQPEGLVRPARRRKAIGMPRQKRDRAVIHGGHDHRQLRPGDGRNGAVIGGSGHIRPLRRLGQKISRQLTAAQRQARQHGGHIGTLAEDPQNRLQRRQIAVARTSRHHATIPDVSASTCSSSCALPLLNTL